MNSEVKPKPITPGQLRHEFVEQLRRRYGALKRDTLAELCSAAAKELALAGRLDFTLPTKSRRKRVNFLITAALPQFYAEFERHYGYPFPR